MKRKSRAKEGIDYLLDPETSRATFLSNNKAALIHGGDAVQVPEKVLQAALDIDLGFEVGLLKGQLANIATIGKELVSELYEEGEKAQALSVSLSCADRTARIVPQLVKALEQHSKSTSGLTAKQKNMRRRILRKLQSNSCSALEVAYLFELNELGELPEFVAGLLQQEITRSNEEDFDAEMSREQINELLAQYKNSNQEETLELEIREKDIAEVKAKMNRSIFSDEGLNDKSK